MCLALTKRILGELALRHVAERRNQLLHLAVFVHDWVAARLDDPLRAVGLHDAQLLAAGFGRQIAALPVRATSPHELLIVGVNELEHRLNGRRDGSGFDAQDSVQLV